MVFTSHLLLSKGKENKMPVYLYQKTDKIPMTSHNGTGCVQAATVRSRLEKSFINFIDMVEMPPKSTVGLHRHADNDEEIYIILSGVGRVLVDGAYFAVSTGDVVVNPPSGEHALTVVGDAPLRMVVVDISTDGERYRAPINLE